MTRLGFRAGKGDDEVVAHREDPWIEALETILCAFLFRCTGARVVRPFGGAGKHTRAG